MTAPLPIVKIELEGMRQSICVALTSHFERLDSDFRAAIDQAVKEFDPTVVFKRHVEQVIDDSVKKAVEHYFLYGEGREAVREAVTAHIRENLSRRE